MANIPTSDFKKGVKVLIDGDPYEMLECNFVKPGKGQALYKCRLRNLLKGSMLSQTFRNGESLESADIHKSDGSYSYRDGSSFYFLDNDSFEQFALPSDSIEEQMTFVTEGSPVSLLFFNGQLISVTPPQTVTMEVTYTEPAARGDTATNVTKAATVECGASVQVPAFIREGDRIRIDVETGKYVERVST